MTNHILRILLCGTPLEIGVEVVVSRSVKVAYNGVVAWFRTNIHKSNGDVSAQDTMDPSRIDRHTEVSIIAMLAHLKYHTGTTVATAGEDAPIWGNEVSVIARDRTHLRRYILFIAGEDLC